MIKKTIVNLPVAMTKGIPLALEKLFDIGDDWIILISGEEIRRPKKLLRVAITRVEITFNLEKDLEQFIKIYKKLNDRLTEIPDVMVMFDGQMVRVKGLTVRFGVAWYDKKFYIKNKNAYLSKMHAKIFNELGLNSNDMRIEHIPL